MISLRWGLLLLVLLVPGPRADAETYQYDPTGRLTQVVYADGSVLRYSYDANGSILQVQVLAQLEEDLFADGFE